MSQEFGKSGDIKRLITPLIILVGFIWLPFSYFLMAVSLHDKNFQTAALSLVLILILAAAIFQHLHRLYRCPLVEISGKFMVITAPMQKRSVYDLTQINRFRLAGPTLFFIHMGWPCIAPVRGLSAEEKDTLIQAVNDIKSQKANQ